MNREAISETLEEFARVLKPRGKLFISVKSGVGEKWEPGDENTPRWFTYWQEDQLQDVLNDGGFQILEMWSNGGWIKCCAIKRAE